MNSELFELIAEIWPKVKGFAREEWWRSWGVVWSSESGGKLGKRGFTGLAGKTIVYSTLKRDSGDRGGGLVFFNFGPCGY
nr:hypothetical protein [Tanacetum cinerariifolium]